jgi:pyruvate dehydrogenase E2 component (dihydrolipoamide acetyltransferase)
MAEEKGIKLTEVSGSGEGGRIVKKDIVDVKPGGMASSETTKTIQAPIQQIISATTVGVSAYEDKTVSQMRKTIARRLSESKFTEPHFYLTIEIDMERSISVREQLNQDNDVRISFNDLVLKACGVALKKHPNVNSSWREDHIRRNQNVHIGMAVAIAEGLVVPVIRFADTLPLSVLAATTKDLGGKAKNGKLQPKDWEGNTFTVSNLGMFGIEQFTSIINNPKNESCILSQTAA